MYKEDLALNNQQWLICHESKQNQRSSNNLGTACAMATIFFLYSLIWTHHTFGILLFKNCSKIFKVFNVSLNLQCKYNTKLDTYQGESKVLQYFHKMRHNLAAPNAFAKVLKVTDYIGLWDVKLTWYSPNTTHQICLYCWGSCNLSQISWTVLVTVLWSTAFSPYVQQMFLVASEALWAPN